MVESVVNKLLHLPVVLVSLCVALVLPVFSVRADEALSLDNADIRAASINLCTDQLLMLLADPQQIVALSNLSRDQAGSFYFEKAQAFAQIDPVAEDLLPLSPDIIITGPYTSRYTLALLDELGLRVETIPIANSVDDMLGNVERLGELIDQPARAQLIVSQVRERLAKIAVLVAADASQKAASRTPRVAVYDPNGYTVGRETLRGELIELSGWTNVASEQGIENYGVLGLEQLIKLVPQALIESPYSADTYSRGQMLAKHPAIQFSGLDPLIINVPSNQTICAGPWIVDVIEQLAEARDRL